MNNQPNAAISKEKSHTQHYGAHSGSHAGGSDYNDGGNLSHWGGNDDYILFTDETEVDFDGSTALGNENESTDEDDSQDFGKSHSGL